jgi:hypothetical protein
MAEEQRTYILDLDNGKRRKVTVPASWKVTFGPAAVGLDKASSGNRLKVPMALRFYENKENQRAIFTDVISFRDSSIQIEEEVINTQVKQGFMEVDGARKAVHYEARTKEWVDPDSDSPKTLLPAPKDSDMFVAEVEEE